MERQINVLMSKLNNKQNWIKRVILPYLDNEAKVTVLAFSYWECEVNNESDWGKAYSRNGKYYDEIVSWFETLGIKQVNINFVNYFSDNCFEIEELIRDSKILFLPGGAPDLMMKRIKNKGIEQVIKDFNGIIIGCSAGAMVQCSDFHITPCLLYDTFTYHKGLDLLPNYIDVEVHYKESEQNINSVKRSMIEKGKKVLLLDDDSVAVFCDGIWRLHGNAKFQK